MVGRTFQFKETGEHLRKEGLGQSEEDKSSTGEAKGRGQGIVLLLGDPSSIKYRYHL